MRYNTVRDFSQDVAGVLYAERRGKGLYLFEKRRQRHALVFRLASHARTRRADMQRHGQHGTRQRVVRQLEPLLHGVQVPGRKSFPGHHIVRQHRPCLGGHIRCTYDLMFSKISFAIASFRYTYNNIVGGSRGLGQDLGGRDVVGKKIFKNAFE